MIIVISDGINILGKKTHKTPLISENKWKSTTSTAPTTTTHPPSSYYAPHLTLPLPATTMSKLHPTTTTTTDRKIRNQIRELNAWTILICDNISLMTDYTLSRRYCPATYDKKSDEGSNSVRMRPENSGALKVVENWLPTRVSDSWDAQLSDYV